MDGVIDKYIFNAPESHPLTFDLPDGFDAFEDNLHQAFPGEAECIMIVVSHIRKISIQLHDFDLLFG